MTKTTAISRKTTWRAYFLGDEGVKSAQSSFHVIYVVPRLGARANLPVLNGHYIVSRGAVFTFSGVSAPHMTGARVTIQYRVFGTRRWLATGLGDVVDRRGRYSRRVAFSKTGAFYLRWHYVGSTAARWLTASSPGRLVRVVSYTVVGFSARVR
jgi:hypothetical protein